MEIWEEKSRWIKTFFKRTIIIADTLKCVLLWSSECYACLDWKESHYFLLKALFILNKSLSITDMMRSTSTKGPSKTEGLKHTRADTETDVQNLFFALPHPTALQPKRHQIPCQSVGETGDDQPEVCYFP